MFGLTLGKSGGWLNGCTFASIESDPLDRDEPTVYYNGPHGRSYIWLRWLSASERKQIGVPDNVMDIYKAAMATRNCRPVDESLLYVG